MKRSRIGLVLISILAVNLLVSNRPVEAAFPGYNGKIIYNTLSGGFHHVSISDSDGSNQQSLISSAGYNDYYAAWSPDGTKIVFRSNRDGNSEIYVMNANGANLMRLTNNAYVDASPSWSPDGSKILFSSNRDNGVQHQVYVMNADGSNQQRLSMMNAENTAPNWSPLGDKIVYQSWYMGNTKVFVMDADGQNPVQLTFEEAPAYAAYPAYSPDGSKIVFVSSRQDKPEIYSMDADGSNQTRLTSEPATQNGQPKWSPDGTKIIFSRITADVVGDELYVMDADGSNQTRLTYADGNYNYYPVWQSVTNTAPTLAVKSLAVTSGSSQSVDVLDGATDEEALSSSNLSIVSGPAHGLAVVQSGKIIYTPSVIYAGLDSLVYRVCDSFMLDQKCSTKTLPITVTPVLSVAKIASQAVDGSSNITSQTNKPTFSGTTSPLAQVTVEIHSDPIILTTMADSQGDWSITLTSPLPAGNHTVYISSTLNGQTTQLDSFVLGIQATTPNTGIDYSVIRHGGLGLVGLGVVGVYMHRRKRRVPELFPW